MVSMSSARKHRLPHVLNLNIQRRQLPLNLDYTNSHILLPRVNHSQQHPILLHRLFQPRELIPWNSLLKRRTHPLPQPPNQPQQEHNRYPAPLKQIHFAEIVIPRHQGDPAISSLSGRSFAALGARGLIAGKGSAQ
jgi:hypothetical protein